MDVAVDAELIGRGQKQRSAMISSFALPSQSSTRFVGSSALLRRQRRSSQVHIQAGAN